ncbi:uncharacterized protein LOC116302976 [Actinia tenebrosa]|uniref:Uncharacterized protein LOC116302976 n=1 Tax=Actinia tenebrosa TaxID=6105 RepID=A0A6P8IMM1_ACTTE|nr:uncharacterized protein LOC116302976 [Actinia tenebrosa]
MAGGLDSQHKLLQIKEKLRFATTSLQNCLNFSHDCKYLSLLCDFGEAIIIKIEESNISTSLQGIIYKKLEHGNGETLEGQSWSPDDGIYAVLGNKAYLYQVHNDFSLFHAIPLYYIPKDIAISTTLTGEPKTQLKYKTVIAGPNGVEMYDLEVNNSSIIVKQGLHLHADLAIVLVDFSPDLQYLAVAALDCHFGIWNVQSLEGEKKDFWYKHLSTVRITNMAFSHDSQSIAVACWDGVCYIYTKSQPSTQESKTSCQWIQCNHILQSSGERVCGLLTGSLVCWAPDSMSVRFSFANEEGSWLNTLDVKDGKSWTEKIAEKGVEVKGINTLSCQAGDFSVCYLSSQQLLLSRWAFKDKKVISSKNHDNPREVLLYEDLMCSVWLVPEDPKHFTGMTLRWCCYSDEDLEQVKNLCEMLSVNCSNDEQKFRSGVSLDARPAEKCLWDAIKTRGKKDNAKGEDSLSSSTLPPPASTSSSSSPPSSSSFTPLLPQSSLLPSSSSSSSTPPLPQSSLFPPSSSLSSSNCTVNVPFYEPSTLLSSLSVSNPGHFVLASRMVVVLVVLPSIAYVYYQKNKEWKSVVFRDAVTRCCLVQENILVTLSANGNLGAWHLTKNSSFTCLDSLLIQGLQTERAFVVGDVFEPLVLVFDVDTQGEQRVAHVSLQGDTLALAKREIVCMPTPPLTFCSSMLGVCVFFTKENNSYSVLIPELSITYDIAYDERYTSLFQCIMENKKKLLDFVIENQQS